MNIGQKILSILGEEVSPNEKKRYIDTLTYELKQSKSDLAIYSTDNLFLQKWIISRYSKRIAHLFEVETGISPQISIVLKKEKANSKETIIATPAPKVENRYLNEDFNFDTFVVGDSSEFAYATAKAVAQKPGEIYNPLFLFGGVGLGKTHLLQAIGNYNIKKGKKVVYVTSEQFLNSFTTHLHNKTLDSFREKFRKCDVLLIDDIQFFSDKERTQEEFFHTYNELKENNKQIVVTSDRAPKKINAIEDRLKSRFESGLTVEINPPELETKIAIIEKKSQINGILLSKDVITYIATNMGENIREIEGAITQLNAMSTLLNHEITLDFTKDAIRQLLKEESNKVSMKKIVEIVAKETGIKESDILSTNRRKVVVEVRNIAIKIIRELTDHTLPNIARFFNKKDHTTISHALKKIEDQIENSSSLKETIDEIIHKIKTAK